MNPHQLAASQDRNSAIAVMACPGSGKTTTLIAAINNSIAIGTDPQKIAAVTYTNAAANVVRSRLSQPIGYCGTLHGLCLKIMLEYNPKIKLLDEGESWRLLCECAAELGYKGSNKALEEARAEHWSKKLELGNFDGPARVVLNYHAKLSRSHLLEYDLLLASAFYKIQKTEYTRFDEYYVDEAQDWSQIDATIFFFLKKTRFFAVGDCDQAVYGFRGGNPIYFLRYFTGCEGISQHVLKANYRSSANIINAANAMIKHNTIRLRDNEMVGAGDPDYHGASCIAFLEPNHGKFAAMVIRLVAARMKANETVAVLCRTNDQADEMRSILTAAGVPVSEKKYDQIPDLSRVRTLLAFAMDPENDILARLEMAQRDSKNKLPAGRPIETVKEAMAFLDRYHVPSTKMAEMLRQMVLMCPDDEPNRMFGFLLPKNDQPVFTEPEYLQVGTLHWSKGQEFDHVILAYADEAEDSAEDEEERRLYYVGLTRAKKSCAAVGCAQRMIPFKREMQKRRMIRYIIEAEFPVIESTK